MSSDGPTEPAASDELFDLPAGEFVAARDALVRRLRADGAKDDAAAVKSLRRPTLAAWAVNQVVRSQQDVGERLIATATTIQRAQRRALSGVRDDRLREASIARRALVEDLVARGATVLAAAGATPTSHLDDVGRTFEAAATDPDVAARVAEGRLSAPIHPSTDFAAVAGLTTVTPVEPPNAEEHAGEEAGDAGDGADEALARQRREAIRTLQVAQDRADVSRARAAAARDDAARLEGQAEEALRTVETTRQQAAEAAAAAERAVAAARELAANAEAAVATAADAAATAATDQDEADRARARLDELA
jgi:hypothetical protein